MCLDILFHNFYLATLSFSIGFVIGFWNLQQFIKSNTEKKIEMIIFRYWLLWCLVNKLHKKMESIKGNMVSLQTFQTYETNNVIMKSTMKPIMLLLWTNNTQHLNRATIFTSSLLMCINDCFCICSKHTIALKLKIFR